MGLVWWLDLQVTTRLTSRRKSYYYLSQDTTYIGWLGLGQADTHVSGVLHCLVNVFWRNQHHHRRRCCCGVDLVGSIEYVVGAACYSEHWQVTRSRSGWATVKTNKQGKLAEQEEEEEREDKHKCEKTRCQVMGCCCNPNICFFRCFQDTDKGILWPLWKQLSDTAWY